MDWLFRNRRTGEITIAQTPNAPLIVFLVAAVVHRVFDVTGNVGTALTIVSTGALAIWAVDEIARGVNPFRRILGGIVLGAIAVSLTFSSALRESTEAALQRPMSLAERPADCPRFHRIEHAESVFDVYRVAHDAAAGIVQQGAFVPPDPVPPTGRGLNEATLVRPCDELYAVAIDRDHAEEQLPRYERAHSPRFGVEGRAVRGVGHPDERRDLPIDAAYRRHRSPHL